MTIKVFSKPGCGICTSAKQKLDKLGLSYEEKNIEQFVEWHPGWREDGSAEVLTVYSLWGKKIPLLNIDSQWFDYPSAMKFLKNSGLGLTILP